MKQLLLQINKVKLSMVLIKKWVDAYGLTMKEKVAEYILGANGTVV